VPPDKGGRVRAADAMTAARALLYERDAILSG